MKESKFLNKFQQAKEKLGDSGIRWVGDMLFVEKLPKPEKKSKGGILVDVESGADRSQKLSKGNIDYPEFVRVLDVGPGFYNSETGTIESLQSKPGQIVMVNRWSVEWFEIFGDMAFDQDSVGVLGRTRESEVQAWFESDKDYIEYFKAINEEE